MRYGRRWMNGLTATGLATGLAVLAAVGGCQAGGLRPQTNTTVADDQRTRDAADLAYRAKAALDKGRDDEALDLSQRAVSLDPNHAGAWNNLGAILMKRENYRDAMEAFGHAAKLLPNDPRPYQNMAVSLHEAGYAKEALDYFGLSLERDPYWLPSLRGAVKCAQELNIANENVQSQIRRGLMIESDPAWRQVFERARLRVDADIKQPPTPAAGL